MSVDLPDEHDDEIAQVRDPDGLRLTRRLVEGQIHLLSAQIAQLREIRSQLDERESELLHED